MTAGEHASASGLVIRAALPADRPALLAMNNAAVPHVNALADDQWAWLAANVDYFRVAVRGNAPVGFVMAIRHGTQYWSANYAWFAARYEEFLYLDRVVIAPDARRGGVARALYADLVAFATGRWPRIALEVNIDPPNPVSLAFHAAMGFARVGEREYAEGAVAMMVRSLTASS